MTVDPRGERRHYALDDRGAATVRHLVERRDEATTGDEVLLSLYLVGGGWSVERGGDTMRHQASILLERVPPEETGPVVLELADGAVSGRLVDASDRPLADSLVLLHSPSSGRDAAVVPADPEGRFELPFLAAGLYQLAVARRGSGEERPVTPVSVGADGRPVDLGTLVVDPDVDPDADPSER